MLDRNAALVDSMVRPNKTLDTHTCMWRWPTAWSRAHEWYTNVLNTYARRVSSEIPVKSLTLRSVFFTPSQPSKVTRSHIFCNQSKGGKLPRFLHELFKGIWSMQVSCTRFLLLNRVTRQNNMSWCITWVVNAIRTHIHIHIYTHTHASHSRVEEYQCFIRSKPAECSHVQTHTHTQYALLYKPRTTAHVTTAHVYLCENTCKWSLCTAYVCVLEISCSLYALWAYICM